MNRLLKQFWSHPFQVGTITASSPALAKAVAEEMDASGPVLELGAGDGALTQELLPYIPPDCLFEAIEIDPELAHEFASRFPHAKLHVTDAERFLSQSHARYQTIISGIPLAVMNPDKRHRLLQLIQEHLTPTGRFVLFQYSTLIRGELEALFDASHITSLRVWRNVPPAYVFTCHISS